MITSAQDVLKKARELLVEKEWTQGTLARDVKGFACSPHSPDAVSFCITGALSRVASFGVARDVDVEHYYNACAMLKQYLESLDSISRVNDRMKSKDEALALLDKAIALGT